MKEDEKDMRVVEVLKKLHQNENVDIDVEFNVRKLHCKHEKRADERKAHHSVPIEIKICFSVPEIFIFLFRNANPFVTHAFHGRYLTTNSHPFKPQLVVVLCNSVVEKNVKCDHPGCLRYSGEDRA